MCLLGASPAVLALPTGAVLSSGQATVQQPAPGLMLIRQATPKASLDWTRFSIAAGETVDIVQPGRSAVLLNRVVGDDPSLIYGALRSNGSMWLINPRGIVFGASSRVDVGGLVASTLSVSGDALDGGRLQLGAGRQGAGELRSEGHINAVDGTVALVAPQLLHGGQITARRVGLVAAGEVLFDVEGDGLVFFNVRNQGLDTRLALRGGVRADGGTADIRAAARAGFADTVLNLEGVVQARGFGVREGRIVIDGGASGLTRVAGTLDARGDTGGRGGSLSVEGDRLQVEASTRLDASGPAGGGQILLGGDVQGRNAAVRNAVQLDAGSTLALQGDQTLGTLAGSGTVALGGFTLATGSGGDSSFAGVIEGGGGLVKQGSSSVFTLTGASTYTGGTHIDAGTLRLGNGLDDGSPGATSGSLATSAFRVDGLLELARADDFTLPQPVSGAGGVRQSGSGRLLFSGQNKTYGGDTTVARGELATAGADELPDGSALRVAAEGRLNLGGRETLRSLSADGPVALAGDLAAGGDLRLRGAVATTGPLQLRGVGIEAVNAGNRFGGALTLDARGSVALAAGEDGGGVARDLVLGAVRVADGGRIEAGRLTLGSETAVDGGTLQLVATATPGGLAPDAALNGKQAIGLPVAWAEDTVRADVGSRIGVAAGAALDIVAGGGGSVRLLDAGNHFAGSLSVVSGGPDSPWSVNTTALAFGGGAAQNFALQSRVQVHGLTVNIGGAGVVADVVGIRADRLATVGPGAALVARLPYDSAAGTASQLPGLTLELTPAAYDLSFPFGAPGAEGGLRVNVGSRAWGQRTLPLDAGYVTVLLLGPTVNAAGGYRFFFDGAGRQSEIPVFYNGVLPTTPQVENSLSAAVAVSEGARKERFDEAVRTENVAVRLRAGVIAEVGPAPSATQGTEGLRVPASCAPLGTTLGCAKAP